VEWDDLRFLLAVADHGNVAAAARELDVVPPEVAKRLDALETALHCQLLTRTADGLVITDAGKRAIEVARGVAAQLAALTTELVSRGEIAGRLCVTSTAGFVPRARKTLAHLREKYPSLDIDLMVSSHVVDLSRKEADIAVRFFKDQKPGLAMTKLGQMGWSLFASARYLATHTPGANMLDGHKMIGFDATFKNTQGGRWIAANVAEDAIATHVGGIQQALDAAIASEGVCIVPCYLAVERGLQRVTDQVLTTNDVYAVYMADRAEEARIKVVVDALVELFEDQKVAFGGA
jgi:DNA-binding transcriptional LysR family regulator